MPDILVSAWRDPRVPILHRGVQRFKELADRTDNPDANVANHTDNASGNKTCDHR
jgi:hypothetical protein